MPVEYTRDGANVSPPLTWSSLPDRTRSLALICDDPDAPTPAPFVHWVLYNIPPNMTGPGIERPGLPAGVRRTFRPKEVPRSVQGLNDFGEVGYGGPAPPSGRGSHRYRFRLYALDTTLDVRESLTKRKLLADVKGHVLGMGEFTATFSRSAALPQ